MRSLRHAIHCSTTVAVLTACAAEPGPAHRASVAGPVTAADTDALARARAVSRGLDFLHRFASDPANLAAIGDELLWCFQLLSTTLTDPEARAVAEHRARALAEAWVERASVPEHRPGVLTLWDLATTLTVAEALGVRHDPLRRALEAWIPTHTVDAWIGFDPRREPPPTAALRLEGEEACVARGETAGAGGCRPLTTSITDLDVFYDALITAYFGELFGTPFGARHAEVMQWLPQYYPYPAPSQIGSEAYSNLTYLVTHVVYTANDYGRRSLRPIDFPDEHALILESLDVWVAAGDVELYAELVDNLGSFGHRLDTDPRLAGAVAAILKLQNEDGSFGDPAAEAYTRYHTTYNAIDALRVDRYAALDTVATSTSSGR
jgi:hypothetical protein